MPTNTYEAISTSTAVGGETTISLTSIPTTYTDLVIVSSLIATTPYELFVQFNGDTGANYATTYSEGNGTSATSGRSSRTDTKILASYSNNTNPTPVTINVLNYSNTTTHKSILARSSATSASVLAYAGLWRNTAAITSIQLTLTGGRSFSAGATFSVYGITAGAATFTGTTKATGGTITKDSFGYVYHTFTSTNTFTPTSAISNAEILTVAGGGSGGWPYSGGGGGGGVLYSSGLTLANGVALTCSVGGGASGSYGALGAQGTNSTVTGSGFTTLTATGGGAGIARNTFTLGQQNGGSGGGGGATVNVGGTGIAGQGYAGGGSSGNSGGAENGGGGGGAGSNGATATTSGAGNGGAGTNLFANWAITTGTGSNQCYGGGGGGGTNENNFGAGGIGGGGRGAANNTSTESQAGTANTGGGSGGGGAGNTPSSPKNGGSGIVIVRYLGV